MVAPQGIEPGTDSFRCTAFLRSGASLRQQAAGYLRIVLSGAPMLVQTRDVSPAKETDTQASGSSLAAWIFVLAAAWGAPLGANAQGGCAAGISRQGFSTTIAGCPGAERICGSSTSQAFRSTIVGRRFA